ncbi:MAG: TPM domain-containing protein [Chloroflexota bacterium]
MHTSHRSLRALLRVSLAAGIAALGLAAAAAASGPPFPDPVAGQAVYDTAEVLAPATITAVEKTIDAIEERTGAEIAVYTQVVLYPVSSDEAEQHAIALMDQWGVGRKGIDDGLVILFDLNKGDTCHGQVQLYAGPGYRATYLTNEERQAIFENDMLPLLRACDLDGALLTAMARIDANASADHAGTLVLFRQLNAVLGLVVAPLLFLLITGFAVLRWYRTGRDPVYLDDPSILMPAPPPGLTPAAGAAIRDGRVNRRALTTASLDLAARGQLGFKATPGGAMFGGKPEIGIYTGDAVSGDPVEQARLARARSRPMDPATEYLRGRFNAIAGAAAFIQPDRIIELGKHVAAFDSRLEGHLVKQGWFREKPSSAIGRWAGRGLILFIVGLVPLIAGFNLPSSGLVLAGVSLLASAIALFIVSGAMPARTRDGAVIVAMLEAYRRTLEKTMSLARSMGEVAQTSAIPLIESPDDAVVWGVALGLQSDVESVLQRSAEDLSTGRATHAYMPMWYMPGHAYGAQSGPGGGWAPGLMSSSPIPDFGGMMAALGTIGNSPTSSGSGGSGGGGFSGGSSGGGGGGAGGGF